MLAIAMMKRERHVEAWEIARPAPLDWGARMGPTPFGYTRLPDGTLEPHPYLTERIIEAYRQDGALAGYD